VGFEEIVMTIIIHAGNAKGYSFEALNEAKKANFEKVSELMAKADQELLQAHHVQTNMLQAEANGEKVELNLLIVHAQDHLMNATLAKDLISEMIGMIKAGM
jgi:PTS system cellobiose-specific IIA component